LFWRLQLLFLSGGGGGILFAELKLRTSIDISGEIETKSSGYSYYNHKEDVDTSFTLSGDYLRSIGGLGNYLKIGGGFEVMAPKLRTSDKKEYDGEVFFFMPLYLSLQTNPVPPVPELFFRFNLGYNIVYLDDYVGSAWDKKGGIYYAFVTGWEFPFGLFFDITYAFYNASLDSSRYVNDFDITYNRLGVGVGYKFGRVRNS
jgi:hypothetical protein